MTFRSHLLNRGRMDSVHRGYVFPAGEDRETRGDEGIWRRGASHKREVGDLLKLRG